MLLQVVKGIDAAATSAASNGGNDGGVNTEYFVKLAFYDISSDSAISSKPLRRSMGGEKGGAVRVPAQKATPAYELIAKGRVQTTLGDDAGEPTTTATGSEGEAPAASEGMAILSVDPVDYSFLRQGRAGVYQMRCQLSRNGQDYNVPSSSGGGEELGAAYSAFSSSTLFHSFTPQSARPACYVVDGLLQAIAQATEGSSPDALSIFDREIAVRGVGLLPSSCLPRGTSVVVQLSAGGDSMDAVSLFLPVQCESASSLKFNLTAGALTQLCAEMQSQQSAAGQQMEVHMSFFLKRLPNSQVAGTNASSLGHSSSNNSIVSSEEQNTTLLSETPLVFYLCKADAVKLEPNVLKKGSLTTAALRVSMVPKNEQKFPAASEDAVVRIHFPAALQLAPLSLHGPAVMMVDEPAGEGFAVEFDMPSLDACAQAAVSSLSREEISAAIGALDRVSVSLALDGGEAPPETVWCPFHFYSTLARYTLTPAAPPKGGFPVGAAVTLNLLEYCPSPSGADSCKVRVRGAAEDNFVEVNATATDNSTGASSSVSVQFAVPDVGKLPPGAVNGKEKLFYVDVSFDRGTSYDRAEAPQLQIK